VAMTYGGKTHRIGKRHEAQDVDPHARLVKPQRGPCWARPGTSPLPRCGPTSRRVLASPEPCREDPRSPSHDASTLRRQSLPVLDVTSSEALLLARQLHMDFQEVKSIMPPGAKKKKQELRDVPGQLSVLILTSGHPRMHHEKFFRQPKHPKVPHLRNGGIALEHFRQLLRRLFGVEISQHVLEDEDQMGPSAMRETLQEAYAECAADGPIDVRRFITWYRDHFFQMEARKIQRIEDDLTLELAKRHHCSPIDLEHVKCKFDAFDLDKSGIIDHNEFEQMIYSLLQCSSSSDLPRNRLQRFWVEADQDRAFEVVDGWSGFDDALPPEETGCSTLKSGLARWGSRRNTLPQRVPTVSWRRSMPRFCQRSSEPRPSTDAADVRPGGQTHRSWLTDRLTA
ncbi:unnamed protein product, partial [Cladocopium goreaui]